MKNFCFIFVILVFFLSVNALYAESEKENISKIKTLIIPNINIVKKDSPYIYISLLIKTGAANESGAYAGISGMITSLLLNETQNKSKEQIEEIFYNIGGGMSVISHFDYSEIKLITTKTAFPEAMRILGECLSEPKFSSEAIINAKEDSFLGLVADYDNPFQKAYDRFRYVLYETNPYKRSVYGFANSIRNSGAREISAFFNENFNPQQIALTIVGNVSESDVSNAVSKSFFWKKDIPKRRNIYEYEEKIDKNRSEIIFNDVEDDSLTYYMIGWLAPNMKSPDYYKVLLLRTIIGTGKGSRMFKILRQENGIGYNMGCNYPDLKRQSHIYIYVSAKDNEMEKLELTKKLIQEIVKDIKNGNVTEVELARAKNYLISQYEQRNENFMNLASDISVWDSEVSFEAFWDFEKNINSINLIDIKETANKYLNNYAELICLPNSKAEP